MKPNFTQWLAHRLRRTVNSIAFFPALLALFFLLLSYLMILLDYSELGKELKSGADWLKLKDASTARTIISVIAAGILSLTVFSFTMVMVILNQAASQMSNRVLDKLIGNRYQQFVLGFYIGTIVYSLFLLSAIRDIDSGIYVPSLSTYLLIVFAVVDIFLFIYFLHYITQSVKYAVVIRRIYKQTEKALRKSCRITSEPQNIPLPGGEPVLSTEAGIFSGYHADNLLALAQKENCTIILLYPPGTFVLCHSPLALVSGSQQEHVPHLALQIQENLYIGDEQTIDNNVYYGFQQLSEVAVKALSPGINDPGTAVESLRALASLLALRLLHFPDTQISDHKGNVRLITRERSLAELVHTYLLPVWDYGQNDRFIQDEMHHLLRQLLLVQHHPVISKLLLRVNKQRELHECLR